MSLNHFVEEKKRLLNIRYFAFHQMNINNGCCLTDAIATRPSNCTFVCIIEIFFCCWLFVSSLRARCSLTFWAEHCLCVICQEYSYFMAQIRERMGEQKRAKWTTETEKEIMWKISSHSYLINEYSYEGESTELHSSNTQYLCGNRCICYLLCWTKEIKFIILIRTNNAEDCKMDNLLLVEVKWSSYSVVHYYYTSWSVFVCLCADVCVRHLKQQPVQVYTSAWAWII